MKLKRNVIFILLIITFDFLGYMILFPIIPFRIIHLGGNALTYGYLLTSYAVCQLISAPILGSLSDRIGSRIPLLISFAGTTIAFTIILFSRNIEHIIIAIVIDGLTAGNIGIPQAILGFSTDSNNRTKVYALSGFCIGSCVLIGPIITALTHKINIQLPILIALCFVTVNFLMITFFYKNFQFENKSTEKLVSIPAPTTFKTKLFNKLTLINRIKILIVIYLLFVFCSTYFNAGFALLCQKKFTLFGNKIGTSEFSWLLSYAALFSIMVQYFIIKKLLKYFKEKQLIAIGFIMNFTAYIILISINVSFILLITLPLISMSVSLIKPCLISLITRSQKNLKYGTILGICQSISSIILIITPLVSGKIIKSGYLSIWLVLPIVTGGIALIILTLNRKNETINS